MTKVPPSPPDPITRAKSSVDVVLALASILYALGYATWALYAWEFQLGVPPALEAQYLVAGVGPAVILLVLAAVLVRLRRLARTRRVANKKIHNAIESTATVAIMAGAGLILLGRDYGWVPLVVGGILSVSAAFFSDSPIDRGFVKGLPWYGSVVAVLLGLSTILLYSTRLFPRVPVELGGPRVQCVTIDLDRRHFSGATADTLTPNRSPADSGFFRSVPLWLLLQGPHYVFAPGNVRLEDIRGRVFRIGETMVSAIFRDTNCARQSQSDSIKAASH
jgi:hypothetical protein